MPLVRDRANPRRVSLTKLASVGQGGTTLAAAALTVANRKLDLGLDEESVLLCAGALVVLLQGLAGWGQRRATEKVEQMVKPRPSGRELR